MRSFFFLTETQHVAVKTIQIIIELFVTCLKSDKFEVSYPAVKSIVVVSHMALIPACLGLYQQCRLCKSIVVVSPGP